MIKYLALLLLTVSAFGTTITTSQPIRDPRGGRLNGKIIFYLPAPAVDTTNHSPITPVAPPVIVNNGLLVGTVTLVGNDSMSPKMYYSAGFYTSQGQLLSTYRYYVSGQTFDLGTAPMTPVTTSNISLRDLVGMNVVSTNTLLCRNFEGYRCIDPANTQAWSGTNIVQWIASAANDISSSGTGGTILIGPGQFAATGTFTLPSGVCIVGAGSSDLGTVLTWSGSTIGVDIPNGTINACIKNLKLNFTGLGVTGGSNSTAIRAHGTDSSPTYFNTISDVVINFPTSNGQQGVGVFSTGTGPINTSVFLNTFDNIRIYGANQAVIDQGGEGNKWFVQSYKMGQVDGVHLFQTEGGAVSTNNEMITYRSESETITTPVCFSTSGIQNQVDLVCDSNGVGATSINDTGAGNSYRVSAVGTPNLGTMAATSHALFCTSTGCSSISPIDEVSDGTTANPSRVFTADPTTGTHRPGSGYTQYSCTGLDCFLISPTGPIIHTGHVYGMSNGDSFLGSCVTGVGEISNGVIGASTSCSTANNSGEFRSARIAATYNAAGTLQTAAHLVQDTCTLGTNCAVTLSGSATYTNSTSYTCTCEDNTAIGACKVAQTSGSAFTITGTGTDVIRYSCIGN